MADDWTTVAVSRNTHTELVKKKQVVTNKTGGEKRLENFNDVIRRVLWLDPEEKT